MTRQVVEVPKVSGILAEQLAHACRQVIVHGRRQQVEVVRHETPRVRSPASPKTDAVEHPQEGVSIVRPEEDVLSPASPSHQVVRDLFASDAYGPTQARLLFEDEYSTTDDATRLCHTCTNNVSVQCLVL